MLLLVANLGSTSFKFKLFESEGLDAVGAQELASGGADRVGETGSTWKLEAGDVEDRGETDLADHAAAIALFLDRLQTHGILSSIDDLGGIGFKAVHGGPISGAVQVDEEVLDTMQKIVPLAPAHNPPYIAAMKSFREMLPGVPQVACFETAFHATIPSARQHYGVPKSWADDHGIRRYGFHGASNAYIASRLQQLAPNTKRVINLHLGGSCSVCGIVDGKSVAHSMGATPQTGVFHAARVGDFDPFALLALREAGMSDDDIYKALGKQSGFAGLSGVGPDLRDVKAAAADGNTDAQLAIDAFVEHCRRHVGECLVACEGLDALVFTGGIGQHEASIREAICQPLGFVGVTLDASKNIAAKASEETRIDAGGSSGGVQVWVVPTNEELIVARQTAAVLNQQTVSSS